MVSILNLQAKNLLSYKYAFALVSRPCNRCVTTDKADTCRDIQHKKRGRPKMMRDANNNKIRPVSSTATTPTTATQNMSSNRLIPGSNFDFFPMVPAATSNDMMTVRCSAC